MQANAHRPQLMSTPAVSLARETTKRFGATAVMNMEEVIQLFWKVQDTR